MSDLAFPCSLLTVPLRPQTSFLPLSTVFEVSLTSWCVVQATLLKLSYVIILALCRVSCDARADHSLFVRTQRSSIASTSSNMCPLHHPRLYTTSSAAASMSSQGAVYSLPTPKAASPMLQTPRLCRHLHKRRRPCHHRLLAKDAV